MLAAAPVLEDRLMKGKRLAFPAPASSWCACSTVAPGACLSERLPSELWAEVLSHFAALPDVWSFTATCK